MAEASMLRFAFYGRVSTEDQQDPESSRSWQLHRSRQLIEPSEGQIVAEYFDCGHSRSLPWKRRPEASRLLAALRHPDRTFAAVVIGEPQRAFYGNQFSLTFPIFTHYGVELWVPEVGGRIDPGSDAHDLVMTLFGGMSKGERNRVKTRVRSAMGAQTATQGRFLGGRPPYGYRLVDAGPHPHPTKAALGGRLHRLEPDPHTALIVARIFEEYLEGRGYYAIAERLTADAVPSPSGYDPARNPHRHGLAWGKSAVRAILGNPRYTGYQVWGRQRRDEVLLDVDDVAAGHTSRRRWNPVDQWIWSAEPAHQPLVSRATFEAIQARACIRRPRPSHVRRGATPGCTRCAVGCAAGCVTVGCRASGSEGRPTTAAATRPSTPPVSASTIPGRSTCGRSTCCRRSTPGWAG
jgi:site-specific DNA recombinase